MIDKFPEGDPVEVHPARSRADQQPGLNGPSGSPTSPSGRALPVATHTMTPIPGRVDFDRDVHERVEEQGGATDYSGWYCIATSPWPCPASGCDFIAHHLTAAHMIVVWPSADDRQLLTAARDARDLGRNPRVIEWEPGMGICIPFDLWARIGRPVHATIPPPDGYMESRTQL